MALLRYFKPVEKDPLPQNVPSLSQAELQKVNTSVKRTLALQETPEDSKQKRPKYNDYTPAERAQIGKYTVENGPIRASRHFTKLWGKNIPESTARRLKNEYLRALIQSRSSSSNASLDSPIVVLSKRACGRPLLLGHNLDRAVQDYVHALRIVGGVVNTDIVIAATKGIITAKEPSLLSDHGGHVEITKPWVKLLFSRMGYVKRKGSNAGKVNVEHFKEIQEEFLADIMAEVLMNEVHPDLIFNWDQTPVHYVPTGQWTMNRCKEKIIPIAKSDDKRQITAVLAVTLNGEYLPPQVIYEGKTTRCHPKVSFPEEWDIWHSTNHWSNENTMKRYIENIIVPFICRKRESLKLQNDHPALALFDSFRGQTTPAILSLLESHNIIPVQIPANCTDKLQPLDVSINKPVKNEMKKHFQTWYAMEVQKQLKDRVSVGDVKVDMPLAVMKEKSANWILSTSTALQARPQLAINGFKRSGILSAVNSALQP